MDPGSSTPGYSHSTPVGGRRLMTNFRARVNQRANGPIHTSLGHRPRFAAHTRMQGLKARSMPTVLYMERAFSPFSLFRTPDPGRCPGLG